MKSGCVFSDVMNGSHSSCIHNVIKYSFIFITFSPFLSFGFLRYVENFNLQLQAHCNVCVSILWQLKMWVVLQNFWIVSYVCIWIGLQTKDICLLSIFPFFRHFVIFVHSILREDWKFKYSIMQSFLIGCSCVSIWLKLQRKSFVY